MGWLIGMQLLVLVMMARHEQFGLLLYMRLRQGNSFYILDININHLSWLLFA